MKHIEYDIAAVRHYLENLAMPVAESTLLKFASGLQTLPGAHRELFVYHFSLFHALYRIRDAAGQEGWYLHLDPMRIRLIRIPGVNACHYYFPGEGHFCGNAPEGNPWCGAHEKTLIKEIHSLSFDPLRDFYTNPENISFGSSKILEKLMTGVRVYAFRKGEIEAAMEFFGLANPSRRRVQKRYHELAKQYHPDRNGRDDSLMKRLNHSYQVLCEVFVV